MNVSALVCPDCGATEIGVEIAHQDGCPAARATDDMSDRDRAWFEAHPGATEYYRELMPGDLGVASLDAFIPEGKVHVTKQAPGIRTRRLPSVTVKLDIHEGLTPSAVYYLELARRSSVLPEEWVERLGLSGDE